MVQGAIFGWGLVCGEELDFGDVVFLDGGDAAPLVEEVEGGYGEAVDDHGEYHEEVDDYWGFL